MPTVLSRLLPSLASAYGLQAILAAIFVPQANEKYYDLGGALGFLSTTLTSIYFRNGSFDFSGKLAPRQIVLSTMLGLWSVRLGTFLVARALKAGGDSRFDKVKHMPRKFTFFWMAQATWVFLVALPVFVVNVIPHSAHPTLGSLDYTGISIFTVGWLFEMIADSQKKTWRKKKDLPIDKGGHEEKFITSGLWSISRHPNYVGEIVLWSGIYATSLTSLYRSPLYWNGWCAIAALSPVFTWFLLAKVSGVPPLERAGTKRFGVDPKWKEYTNKVPVLWPFIGGTKA